MNEPAAVFWTVVPNGTFKLKGATYLRFSLVATLRPLHNEAHEKTDCDDMLADWPTWQYQQFFDRPDKPKLAIQFFDERENPLYDPTITPSPDYTRGKPSSALWDRLVVQNSSVDPPPQPATVAAYGARKFKVRSRKTTRPIRADMPVTTFSASNIYDRLASWYAAASVNHPTKATIAERTPEFFRLLTESQRLVTEKADVHGYPLFLSELPRNFDLIADPDQAELAARDARRLSTTPEGALRPPVFQAITKVRAPGVDRVAVLAESSTIDEDFLSLRIFHGRARRRELMAAPPVGAKAVGNDSDVIADPKDLDIFDRIASAMNFHRLLRPLGLVTDWTVKIPENCWNAETVQLVAPTANGPQANPRTVVALFPAGADGQAAEFAAREIGEDVTRRERVRGLLPLGDQNRYRLIQGDVNGTALKVANWLTSLLQRFPAALPLQYHSNDQAVLMDVPLPDRCKQLAGRLGLTVGERTTAQTHALEDLVKKVIARIERLDPQSPRSGTRDPYEQVWHSINVAGNVLFSTVKDFNLVSQNELDTFEKEHPTPPNANHPPLKMPITARLHILRDPPELDAAARSSGIAAGSVYIMQLSGGAAYDAQPRVEPPARQSMGFSIIACDRANLVKDRLARTTPTDPNQKVGALHAEDLILGYVPDVRIVGHRRGDDPRKSPRTLTAWHPLTFRQETFENTLIDARLDAPTDGVIRPPASQTTDTSSGGTPTPSTDLTIGESIIRWPGRIIGSDQHGPLDDGIDNAAAPTKITDNGLFRVKLTTLPRSMVPLRFYSERCRYEYEFRTRVYNIAGNALDWSSPIDDARFCARAPYLRDESVLPPVILLDGSLDRSSPTNTLDRLIVSKTHRTEVRWAIPPRIDGTLAEAHGLLDEPLNHVGSFNDVHLEEDGSPPTVLFRKLSDGEKKARGDDRLPVRQLSHGFEPIVPYWPDPMARAMHVELVLLGLKTVAPVTLSFAEGRDWPRWRALRIVLMGTKDDGDTPSLAVERNDAVESDGFDPRNAYRYIQPKAGPWQLVVRLPPGVSGKLRLRAFHDDFEEASKTLSLLASDAAQQAAATESQAQSPTPAQSRVAFLASPVRELEVVHAVPKPTKPPVLDNMAIVQVQGSPTIAVPVSGKIDAGSTGRVTLVATWCDHNMTDGAYSKHAERPQDWPIAAALPQTLTGFDSADVRHTLPDTRRRKVSYALEAASLFDKDFPGLPDGETTVRGKAVVHDIAFNGSVSIPSMSHLVPLWKRTHELRKGDSTPIFASEWQHVGFRIFFRDAFVTGCDEKIAIALRASEDSRVKNEKQTGYTVWGVDPLLPNPVADNQSPLLRFDSPPCSKDFERSAADVSNIVVALTEGDPVPADEPPLTSQKVDLLTYAPKWDEAQKLFFIDVSLCAAPARALIRLMLLRYQSNVLAETSADFPGTSPNTSPVLRVNFAQLFPGRCVTVWRDPERSKVMHYRIDLPSTETVSPPPTEQLVAGERRAQFRVTIYAPVNGEWVVSDEPGIAVVSDATGRNGTITWSSRTGPRKLLITEEETFTGQQPRVIYFDVLDV